MQLLYSVQLESLCTEAETDQAGHFNNILIVLFRSIQNTFAEILSVLQ